MKLNSQIHPPEILAPAGNLDKLKVACLYGASAVYVGGLQYGLRSGADNFDEAQLKAGIKFAKSYGVKVYVTLNAFLHDQDFKNLEKDIESMRDWGVDAFIISDPGVMCVAAKVGGVALHLSTQATCLNQSAARLWSKLGVSRIITGRELSIREGQALKEQTGLEVEMFIHGAMCSAYSGNCTISNYTAGRDSNRGGCKQSCRFHYQVNESEKTHTLMSSKDLNGLALMQEWVDSGMDSLKIEGRMKSCLYVASTSKAYREGVESVLEERPIEPWAFETLNGFSNRGYTEASLVHMAESDSIVDSHEMGAMFSWAGQIVKASENRVWLQLKNPVKIGDELEVLTFKGPNVKKTIKSMKALDGELTERATQEKVVELDWSGLESGMIVRRVS